jgi:large subunit ribosomal protein L7/L12
MSTAEATTNFDAAIKDLGDKIVSLSLLQAKSLADYLEQVHGSSRPAAPLSCSREEAVAVGPPAGLIP